MSKILDKLGQEIRVGSFIVYGHLMGRSAGLKVGKVLDARTVEKPEYGFSSGYRITVVGIEEHFWDKEGPKLGKKGTLQFPDRCIVIQAHQLPTNYLKLLNTPS